MKLQDRWLLPWRNAPCRQTHSYADNYSISPDYAGGLGFTKQVYTDLSCYINYAGFYYQEVSPDTIRSGQYLELHYDNNLCIYLINAPAEMSELH